MQNKTRVAPIALPAKQRRSFKSYIIFPGIVLCCLSHAAYSQLDVFALVGKRAKEYDLPVGFGGYLKFAVPVSQADDVTLEWSFIGWDEFLSGYMALKAGYLFTLNRKGYGWFVEPQAGYILFGADPNYDGYRTDNKFTGGLVTCNAGYRFGKHRFKSDLGLRYEQAFTKVGGFSTVGLRFAISIGFGRGRFAD